MALGQNEELPLPLLLSGQKNLDRSLLIISSYLSPLFTREADPKYL